MNRIIKFRAWDKDNSKMLKPIEINNMIKGLLEHAPTILGNYELMQFTGLTDKKGKEIYEGDIIKGVKEGSDKLYKNNGVILYDSNQALFKVLGMSSKKCLSIMLKSLSVIEVVGNVYENPTLWRDNANE